jgi:hypothetical protein
MKWESAAAKPSIDVSTAHSWSKQILKLRHLRCFVKENDFVQRTELISFTHIYTHLHECCEARQQKDLN